MQRYQVVRVMSNDEKYVEAEWEYGLGLLDTQTLKMQTVSIYEREELGVLEELAQVHNERALILSHWPDQKDPEVQAILEDPEFLVDKTLTRAYAIHQASETVARRRAGLGE